MKTINISYLSTDKLTANKNNARTHSKKQLEQIAKSIKSFGFITPLLINYENTIICGHGRFEAAIKLGYEKLPTVQITHLTEAQERAYMLADNKLALNAGWDEQQLQAELSFLVDPDIEIDAELSGFEMGEIDLYLESEFTPEPEKNNLPDPSGPIVSQFGDCFMLGPHRIICGDCREPSTLKTVMDGNKAQVVCTDPPFNVKIKNNVTTNTSLHPEFAMASGEMSSDEFTQFLTESLSLFYTHSQPGSVHFIFMDWRHIPELLAAANPIYDEILNLCVWAKTNAGMGSLYRSQHELIFVFKKSGASHINNVQLGKYRHRSNIWSYAGMNTFGQERDDLLKSHPTVKPLGMITDAIKDVTNRGDIVLDGFLGSGTTLIAAEQCGRVCYGIEYSPQYIDCTIKRFQSISKQEVIHVETGLTFSELQAFRANETISPEPSKEVV